MAGTAATLLGPERARRLRDTQRQYRQKYAGVNIVSVGEQCLPRTFMSRWGFKPTKAMGEPSIPFDLAVHRVEMAVEVLANDFETYFDELTYVPTGRIVMSRRTGVTFNHEQGAEYAEADYRLIREIYGRRIDNFRRLMLDPTPTVVVWANSKSRADIAPTLKQLVQHVARLRRDRPTTFLAYQLFAAGMPLPTFPDVAADGLDVRQVYRHLPFPGYVWHNPEHCFSPEGFSFEEALAQQADEALDAFVRQFQHA